MQERVEKMGRRRKIKEGESKRVIDSTSTIGEFKPEATFTC